jgi:NitT/TauT family transport system substrate-binding protein
VNEPVKVALGLGFIPSVQFAPFYVAQEKGFFAEQGLDVQFQHGMETDFLKLVGVNQMQFAVGSGEQVILGRSQGLPLTYALAWYNQFPVAVMSLAEQGLDTPQALEGQRVGIPGMFGASLVAWKALVYAAGLDESQVKLESIGFTQAAAVSEGRVDAALDYVTNGPVQLRLAGKEVNVLRVSDYIDLPSNGLITNEQTIAESPDLVQRMINATLAGIRYTLANPDEAFAISLRAVPEAGGDNEAANRAIFDASLALWRADDAELGLSDPAAWQEASDFMSEMGLIDSDVPSEGIFTNQFVDAAPKP